MASFSGRSRKLASLKVALVSSFVLSLAIILKLSLPVISDFVLTELPSLWNFALSWLRPPYLYILINCIIISIVASSKLQNQKGVVEDVMIPPPYAAVPSEPVKFASEYSVYNSVVSGGYAVDGANVEARRVDFDEPEVTQDVVGKVDNEKSISGDGLSWEETVSKSVGTGLERKDSMDLTSEKENERPTVSTRFAHRRAMKLSPQGGKVPLGVSKPKKQETLENTWKTITEGRIMPLARHLRKSDTWDSHVRRPIDDRDGTPPQALKMKKAETFSERTSKDSSLNSSPSPSPVSGKLRRDMSLSQDELNRRVEAFIKKFNEEMRLQRQESLNQYKELVSR